MTLMSLLYRAQYVISHMSPETRRSCEDGLLHDYYNEIISKGTQNYSFEDCKREYVQGMYCITINMNDFDTLILNINILCC